MSRYPSRPRDTSPYRSSRRSAQLKDSGWTLRLRRRPGNAIALGPTPSLSTTRSSTQGSREAPLPPVVAGVFGRAPPARRKGTLWSPRNRVGLRAEGSSGPASRSQARHRHPGLRAWTERHVPDHGAAPSGSRARRASSAPPAPRPPPSVPPPTAESASWTSCSATRSILGPSCASNRFLRILPRRNVTMKCRGEPAWPRSFPGLVRDPRPGLQSIPNARGRKRRGGRSKRGPRERSARGARSGGSWRRGYWGWSGTYGGSATSDGWSGTRTVRPLILSRVDRTGHAPRGFVPHSAPVGPGRVSRAGFLPEARFGRARVRGGPAGGRLRVGPLGRLPTPSGTAAGSRGGKMGKELRPPARGWTAPPASAGTGTGPPPTRRTGSRSVFRVPSLRVPAKQTF